MSYKDDPLAIDGTKIQYHLERVIQSKTDPLNTYPIYVEVSPVGHCNHRCLHGDTLINTVFGNMPIKELIGRNIPIFTYSPETKQVFVADAINIQKMGNEAIVRVHFDDGTYIDCTPDHKFLRFNWKNEYPTQAQSLREGDRVRAITARDNGNGYISIWWGRKGKRMRSRLIMDYLMGRKLKRTEQVHHKDKNRSNDHPDNLEYCASAKEHSDKHPENSIRMKENNPAKNMTPEWKAKITASLTGLRRTDEQRLRYRNSKLGTNNPNYKNGQQSLINSNKKSRIKEINHIVVRVEELPNKEDVYCMEVPATGWFFANDVLVKNCTFCAVDYIGYKARSIDKHILGQTLIDMANLGVKSVMFAGEGEPLLHKDITEITHAACQYGLDVSFTTNGVLLDKLFPVIDSIKWIKVSLNAGDPQTYEKIHKAKPDDWNKVWNNLERAISIRQSSTKIGVQTVVLPDNIASIENLIKKAKGIGIDYVVLKPYSQHKSSITTEYKEVNYKDESYRFLESLTKHNTESFKVVVRSQAIEDAASGVHQYEKCLSTPYFWAYIMATGDVYGCSAYLLNDDFNYGNINRQTFKEIWTGSSRQKSIVQMQTLDIGKCRLNCRMNSVNKWLWDVANPSEHVNFI